jgi:tetratricopeptide (TPR) repeat protein
VEYFPAISATEVETMIEENGAAAAFESHSAATPSKTTSSRQKWMAGLTIAVAAGLLCILASPLIRSHAKPAVEPLPYSLNTVGVASGVPYRSQVAGVDDLYLQGIYFYEQRTPESLERSRDDFTAAIAKDKNYAPAYAGLSNTYNLLREYSVMPEPEAYAKAKAAAEHAVALDPKLPQAHASLGFIDFFWSWDIASAEREFQTALALDPTSALAHHWYGSMLIHEGRYSEAIEQLDIAQRLQPTSAAVLSTRALALGLSGHRNEAVDMLQDVINDSPGVSSPHQILAILSQIQPRDLGRYLDESRRVAELRHSDEMLQVSAAAEPAYRSGGENAMWLAILATEERLHPGPTNRTYLMADAEANLGRKDGAFTDLTQVAKRRDPHLIGIKMDPNLQSLHQDPRFDRLIASVGLPPLTH